MEQPVSVWAAFFCCRKIPAGKGGAVFRSKEEKNEIRFVEKSGGSGRDRSFDDGDLVRLRQLRT